MKENQIIDAAKLHFEAMTRWGLVVKQDKNKKKFIDGESVLLNPKTKEKVYLSTEIKNEIRNSDILNFVDQKEEFPDLFLIAQYISKPIRDQLRYWGINYLESSGNCYINKNSVLIFVESEKAGKIERTNKAGKLNTDGAMRFVYACFLNSQILKMSYRQIAKEAEVALGNVGSILEALQSEGFLEEKEGIRSLKNKPELFDLWANQFAQIQRPQLIQKSFSFATKGMRSKWKDIQLKQAYWGGEPAANLLDNFLLPANFVLFSPLTTHQLMKTYKLVPDNDNPEVLHMLPPFKNRDLPDEADPFIIYAELISSSDSRCLEAAARIKEKYIDPQL